MFFQLQIVKWYEKSIEKNAFYEWVIYKSIGYENASLVYIGINRHEDDAVGRYDKVISNKEYRAFKIIWPHR